MEQIIKVIQNNKNFVLSGHISPDGDAVGSCYGLAFALEKLDKNVAVVLEPYPQKYNILPGREFLYSGPLDKIDFDVLIALDCADINRLGPGQPLFARAKHTVCIDHHKTNPGFAEFNYIEPAASSTSEVVFRLIEKLTSPCENIAAAIYAGIVDDTGGFKYNSTSASTMEIAGRLMGMGIPFTKIYSEVVHNHSFAAGKAKGIILEHAKQIADGRIVYSHITREELASVGADSSDLDGNVEYLLNTSGVEISALVYEGPAAPQVKISLRSKGPDVGAVAVTLGGGGHQMAAGATVKGDISRVLEQVLALL